MTHVRDLARASAAAILGALLGAAGAVASYLLAPDLIMKMDTDPPALVRGLYPVERGPDGVSYAWSKDVVTISLPGLDRQHPWEFRLRFRGAREDPSTLPYVQTLVDEVTVDMRQAANQFQDVAVKLPTNNGQQRGARITIRCSNTFVPGPGDNRQLGIIIDEMRVVRLSDGVPFVPRPALAAATLGGAIFGAFFGLIGLTAGGAAIAVFALACGQGIALVHGAGPYTQTYTSLVPGIAAWLTVLSALAVSLTQRLIGQRLRNTARFALAFTVGALYLKLLVLTHPSMPVGDALFQAHRFEWVRDGRYYFTSIAPGGYEFPYAIGLYLVALPFASLVHGTLGFMVLLRVIVAISDAAAGLLLYPMIARTTNDRLAGAIAVALFHLLPLNFQVQTTGNLTNAFAQSLFLACVAAIVLGWPSPRYGYVTLTVLTIGITCSLASHTSTAAIFVPMLLLAGLAIWQLGPSEDAGAGRSLLIVAAIATTTAFALYYGHFGSTYAAQFHRIGREMAKPAEMSDPGGRSVTQRLTLVPYYLNTYYGWPTLALAIVGATTLARRGRDRLTLTIWSWLVTAALFLLIGILTPVDMRYYLAAFPAIALLGALGASFLWRSGPLAQSATVLLLLASVILGVHNWVSPLR